MFSTYIVTILIISVITFLFYSVDKSNATKNRNNRIPEVVLLSLTASGGVIGTLLAMVLIRHKNKKFHFLLVSVVSAIIQLIIIPVLLLK